jgi:hypothetical protein
LADGFRGIVQPLTISQQRDKFDGDRVGTIRRRIIPSLFGSDIIGLLSGMGGNT